jgi:preprotein translocase subunit SecA
VTVQQQPPEAAQPLPGPGQPLRTAAAGAAAIPSGAATSGSGVGASFRPGASAPASTAGGLASGSLPIASLAGVPGGATSRQMQEIAGGGGIAAGTGTTGGVRPGYTPTGARIGRNDVCWCGSGLKYKKCHGR